MMARRVIAGRSGFSPKALFANGEQGVWYDPSDLTTLFQDAAGTIPVTAVEQPVGLVLDKSKGLALGPELVTNGTFDTGTTGWTVATGGSFTVVGGVGRLLSVSQETYVSAPVTTVIGKWYKVSVGYVQRGGSVPTLRVGTSKAGRQNANVSLPDTATPIYAYFVATSTTTYISLMLNVPTLGVYVDVDNISVRELPGNHAVQSVNTGYRPLLKQDENGNYYLLFDGTNDAMATSAIDFTATDKMTVWAGVRKLSDANQFPVIVELSNGLNVDSFALYSSGNASNLNAYCSSVRGNSGDAYYYLKTFASPTTNVVLLAFDIAGATIAEENKPRVNGTTPTLVVGGAGPAGSGNYGNYPLYIGARGGASLYFNGRLYSLIVRGAQSSANLIAATERYVARKTGVVL